MPSLPFRASSLHQFQSLNIHTDLKHSLDSTHDSNSCTQDLCSNQNQICSIQNTRTRRTCLLNQNQFCSIQNTRTRRTCLRKVRRAATRHTHRSKTLTRLKARFKLVHAGPVFSDQNHACSIQSTRARRTCLFKPKSSLFHSKHSTHDSNSCTQDLSALEQDSIASKAELQSSLDTATQEKASLQQVRCWQA